MDDNHTHLKIAKQCLVCVGYWPIKFKSKVLQFLYSAYFKFIVSVYVTLVVTQCIEMYNLMGNNLEEISDLMGTQLLYTQGLVKAWVIAGKTSKKIVRKIRLTEENILKSDDAVKAIYMKHVAENHRVNRIMTISAFICYLLFCLNPVLIELLNGPIAVYDNVNGTKVYRARPLPLISWFPFDRYKHYKISFAWHLVAISAVSPYIVGCNNFFFSLTTFAVGQIKILQYNLKQLKNESSNSNRTLFNSSRVSEELKKCVVYHNCIISFVAELSKTMKDFLLLDFAACALQMAVIGFQAAVTKASFQLVKTLMYLATMLTQLFLYYWYGNEILLESKEVAQAVWESDWYKFDNKTKRSLAIVILRSQRPLKVSVGPFYHMSTQTMIAIIKAGYSYAALMQQLYL